MLTERFDEGLMLLRRIMRWHFIDATYVSLNPSRPTTTGRISKEGTEVFTRPHYDDLSPDVRRTNDNTKLCHNAYRKKNGAHALYLYRVFGSVALPPNVAVCCSLRRTTRCEAGPAQYFSVVLRYDLSQRPHVVTSSRSFGVLQGLTLLSCSRTNRRIFIPHLRPASLQLELYI